MIVTNTEFEDISRAKYSNSPSARENISKRSLEFLFETIPQSNPRSNDSIENERKKERVGIFCYVLHLKRSIPLNGTRDVGLNGLPTSIPQLH